MRCPSPDEIARIAKDLSSEFPDKPTRNSASVTVGGPSATELFAGETAQADITEIQDVLDMVLNDPAVDWDCLSQKTRDAVLKIAPALMLMGNDCEPQ